MDAVGDVEIVVESIELFYFPPAVLGASRASMIT